MSAGVRLKAYFSGITIFLILFYIATFIWWLSIFLRGIKDTNETYTWGVIYAIIPFFGGLFGILRSKKFGHFKTAIGRAIFFLSAGLVAWSLGSPIWFYYNLVLKVPVPYPSWADAAYILNWPLYFIGIVYLVKAIGMTFKLEVKKAKKRFLFFFIPLLVIGIFLYLFLIFQKSEIHPSTILLELFLDIVYLLEDFIVMAIIAGFLTLIKDTSFNYWGMKFKIPIFIILSGFVLNFAADFVFIYTTLTDIFFVASWMELLYPSAMFLLALGINLLDPRLLYDSE